MEYVCAGNVAAYLGCVVGAGRVAIGLLKLLAGRPVDGIAAATGVAVGDGGQGEALVGTCVHTGLARVGPKEDHVGLEVEEHTGVCIEGDRSRGAA